MFYWLYKILKICVLYWNMVCENFKYTTFDELRFENCSSKKALLINLPPTSSFIKGNLYRCFFIIQDQTSIFSRTRSLSNPCKFGQRIGSDATFSRAYSREKGHLCDFSEKAQKKGKTGQNIWKFGQKCTKFGNILKKGSLMHAIITCMKQLEYALFRRDKLLLSIPDCWTSRCGCKSKCTKWCNALSFANAKNCAKFERMS